MAILFRWEAKTGEKGFEVVPDKAAGEARLEELFQQYGGFYSLKAFNVGQEIDTSPYMQKFGGDPDVNNIPGLVDLPTGQAEIFKKTYRRHLKTMGAGARADYMPGSIQKVAYEPENDVVIVTFKTGNWWHYDANGWW